VLNRYSPLRYPGGKGKITDYIRLIFDINGLNDGHYLEPFAGGAAVGLGLLFNENARHVHINDIDRSIFAFWYSILNDTEKFCRNISDTRLSVEQWQMQKDVQKNKNSASLFELGFSTFFLNRTNRSGIINGGLIGGKSQLGKWGMDARFNKTELISRIEKIAAFANRISLYNLDACELLKIVSPKLPDNSLIYFDPPYFEKGNRLYHSYYKHDDHSKLAKLIQNSLKNRWLVSYDNVPEIDKIYCDRRKLQYKIGYSARSAYDGSELMIFSDNLIFPNLKSPITAAT
jgi:DNA adenine methylase